MAGVGLLGFQHVDVWFNLDFAGISLLGVGGGIAYSTTLDKKDAAAKVPRKFKFTKLNDEARLESDLSALDDFRDADIATRCAVANSLAVPFRPSHPLEAAHGNSQQAPEEGSGGALRSEGGGGPAPKSRDRRARGETRGRDAVGGAD